MSIILSDCLVNSFGITEQDCSCYPDLVQPCSIYGVYLDYHIPLKNIAGLKDNCGRTALEIIEKIKHDTAVHNYNELQMLINVNYKKLEQKLRIGKEVGVSKSPSALRYVGMSINVAQKATICDLKIIGSKNSSTSFSIINTATGIVAYSDVIQLGTNYVNEITLNAGNYVILWDTTNLKVEQNKIKCGDCPSEKTKLPSCISAVGSVKSADLLTGYVSGSDNMANGLTFNVKCCCNIDDLLCAKDGQCDNVIALSWASWHYAATVFNVCKHLLLNKSIMSAVNCTAEHLEQLMNNVMLPMINERKKLLIDNLPNYSNCIKCISTAHVVIYGK